MRCDGDGEDVVAGFAFPFALDIECAASTYTRQL